MTMVNIVARMERSEIRESRDAGPGLRFAYPGYATLRAVAWSIERFISGRMCPGNAICPARPHSSDAIDQTASLATFNGDALTVLLAGLAANSIGSFVNGLMPLRASVAGLLTTDILTKPGMTNSPDSFSSL